MNAFELSNIRIAAVEELEKMHKAIMDAEDEYDTIIIDFAEAEKIYDICHHMNLLLTIMLQNTQVENTSKPGLPF